MWPRTAQLTAQTHQTPVAQRAHPRLLHPHTPPPGTFGGREGSEGVTPTVQHKERRPTHAPCRHQQPQRRFNTPSPWVPEQRGGSPPAQEAPPPPHPATRKRPKTQSQRYIQVSIFPATTLQPAHQHHKNRPASCHPTRSVPPTGALPSSALPPGGVGSPAAISASARVADTCPLSRARSSHSTAVKISLFVPLPNR